MTNDKGPEPLAEILSRLFTARGWGRRHVLVVSFAACSVLLVLGIVCKRRRG